MSRQEARETRRTESAEARQPKDQQDPEKGEKKAKKDKLPPQWESVQGAIWMIGLAILFWQGWIFPGIFVLIAVSGLSQAAMLYYVNQQQEKATLTTVREVFLPENCPSCGGPITAASVKWTGRTTATCPFCGSTVKARETSINNQAAS